MERKRTREVKAGEGKREKNENDQEKAEEGERNE